MSFPDSGSIMVPLIDLSKQYITYNANYRQQTTTLSAHIPSIELCIIRFDNNIVFHGNSTLKTTLAVNNYSKMINPPHNHFLTIGEITNSLFAAHKQIEELVGLKLKSNQMSGFKYEINGKTMTINPIYDT